MQTTDQRVDATLWLDPAHLGLPGEPIDGQQINIEVERTDRTEVALHTFINGEGSKVSIYVNREDAIELARQLLGEARPDWRES